MWALSFIGATGSSPLARGALNGVPHNGDVVGLIPASAGSTRSPHG